MSVLRGRVAADLFSCHQNEKSSGQYANATQYGFGAAYPEMDKYFAQELQGPSATWYEPNPTGGAQPGGPGPNDPNDPITTHYGANQGNDSRNAPGTRPGKEGGGDTNVGPADDPTRGTTAGRNPWGGWGGGGGGTPPTASQHGPLDTTGGGQLAPRSAAAPFDFQTPNAAATPLAPQGQRRGLDTSMAELNQLLSKYGGSASYGGMDAGGGGRSGAVSINIGGRTYTNMGSSHEGAGPGDQSRFLSGIPGMDPRDAARIDQASEGARSLGMAAERLGLDPNTASYQDIVGASAAQRTQAMSDPRMAALQRGDWAEVQRLEQEMTAGGAVPPTPMATQQAQTPPSEANMIVPPAAQQIVQQQRQTQQVAARDAQGQPVPGQLDPRAERQRGAGGGRSGIAVGERPTNRGGAGGTPPGGGGTGGGTPPGTPPGTYPGAPAPPGGTGAPIGGAQPRMLPVISPTVRNRPAPRGISYPDPNNPGQTIPGRQPGPNANPGWGQPLSPVDRYTWGSGGAEGNRQRAGSVAFGQYMNLINNPDVDPQTKNDILTSAAKAARARYLGAGDQIQRGAMATGASAGVPGSLAYLADAEGRDISDTNRQTRIALEQERQRRREEGISGISGMYGTETGYTGNLLAQRAGLATRPTGINTAGQTTGTQGGIDFGKIFGMLAGA